MRELTIGLLGLGTVGTGVVELLERHRADLRRRLGCGIRVKRVAVRHLRRKRGVRLPSGTLTGDAKSVVTDPEVDVVVELFGGIEPARSLVIQAMRAGKHVVTANKALLSQHGEEVIAEAERNAVHLGFEASIAGGIPIVRTLREALVGDRTRALYGIVNGTCNWILTAMSERSLSFSEALTQAQRLGLAEADPGLDIDGDDAAHKLSLLATLAFGARCPLPEVHKEGIRSISPIDVEFASELGYAIKLLAIAVDDGKSIEARVHPTMIPKGHLLADVRDATNAIHVESEALGATTYVGEGAGKLPTAISVLADVAEIAHGRGGAAKPPLGISQGRLARRRFRKMGDVQCEYYLRVMALDRPGVLAEIAGALGRHRISIATVLQRDRKRGTSVPIILRTHEARERNMRAALDEIRRRPVVRGRPAVIRIEEHL